MPLITIPKDGEYFLGFKPGIYKVRKVSVGFTGSGADVIVTATGTFPLANIPAGAHVLAVLANIDTAWTATLTLTLGDAASAAGYFASADLAPQTAVSTGAFKNSLKFSGAYTGGKFYASASTIDVVIGVAAPAAGKMTVWIIYADQFAGLD